MAKVGRLNRRIGTKYHPVEMDQGLDHGNRNYALFV